MLKAGVKPWIVLFLFPRELANILKSKCFFEMFPIS